MRKQTIALFLTCALSVLSAGAQAGYVPSEANRQARKEFSEHRLGIFLHWGVYSMFAQGEWYYQTKRLAREPYVAAAAGFNPYLFNASEWARAFKDAGAGYVCLTTRHCDGFSLWPSDATDFDVDATPSKRDLVGELTQAVKAEGMRMHFYYSLMDWIREDYPSSTKDTRKDPEKADYNHYFEFMTAQIRELMTRYHPGGFWLDGWFDHKNDPEPFNWRLDELYSLIHGIDDACLIGNNHHIEPFPGEDFQMFERLFPGEKISGRDHYVSREIPLEMCEPINDSWGFKIEDRNYKSVKNLIRLLVRNTSRDANLLLNIGPYASGALPDEALERLKGIGEWMRQYSRTVDGCGSAGYVEQPWGYVTRNEGSIFLHIFDPAKLPSNGTVSNLVLPFGGRVASAVRLDTGEKCAWKQSKDGFLSVTFNDPSTDAIDTIIEVSLK